MEWERGPLLGRGSFGTVNLATVHSKGEYQIMAVKSATVSQSSSLRNEKEILLQLRDCPQILRCFGDDLTTEDSKQFYNLFLEYVPGGTLADRVKKSGGGLPESDVRRYLKSIVEGLSHIHRNDFIHCDIKLQNLLVGASSGCFDVKIADFGLSKKAGEKAEGGVWLRGTPLYMSPESVARGEYEAPSDVWSLGCVAVEMITGKPAWKFPVDADANAVLFRIGFGDELPEIPSELSEEGRDFLSRCFVRDPELRWTAEMLLNHPFVMEAAKSAEAPSVSPRSAFDFPQWRSLRSSSSPSFCSSTESFTLSRGEFDQAGDSPSSLSDRIRQLATGKLPDWPEDGWVTARRADSSVFRFRDEAGEEESHISGSSDFPRSNSLLVLEEMLSRDGNRNRNSIQSEVEPESAEFMASSSSTTVNSLFTSLSTKLLPQFRYGSNGEANSVSVLNSAMDFGCRRRRDSGGSCCEQFESIRCNSLACKMNVESDAFSDFGDFSCSDYYISNEYKHSNFTCYFVVVRHHLVSF